MGYRPPSRNSKAKQASHANSNSITAGNKIVAHPRKKGTPVNDVFLLEKELSPTCVSGALWWPFLVKSCRYLFFFDNFLLYTQTRVMTRTLGFSRLPDVQTFRAISTNTMHFRTPFHLPTALISHTVSRFSSSVVVVYIGKIA